MSTVEMFDEVVDRKRLEPAREITKPIVGPDPLTAYWYKARKNGFGGSEAAGACGVSRYDTPYSLYLRKRGELDEFEGNDATEMGLELEPIVVRRYAKKTGRTIAQAPMPMLIHPDVPYMFATPDAMLDGNELLSVKTTASWPLAKELADMEGTDFVPAEWVIQGQQEMAITGAEVCHVALLLFGRDLRTFRIDRNDDLIASMIRIEGELWQRIVDGNPPSPDFQHPRTADMIHAMHGLAEGTTIALGEDAEALWMEQEGIAEQIKELTARRKSIRAQIEHAMGEAALGTVPSGNFVIARNQVNRKGYSVDPTTYITLSAKTKGKKP